MPLHGEILSIQHVRRSNYSHFGSIGTGKRQVFAACLRPEASLCKHQI